MPIVTLSFDNGPSAEATPEVLSVLKAKDVRATFFVVGAQLLAEGARDLMARAHEEGHWIGNHTMTHSIPLGEIANAETCRREISDAEALIGEFAHPDKLFRPFGGGGHLDRRLLNRASVKHLTGNAYSCVLWNVVPRDWENAQEWDAVALAACARLPWSVVVLHDIPGAATQRLSAFIDVLQEAGYDMVQQFPDDCVPIRRGRIVGELDGLVSP